jgi:hypothetical protein
MSKFGNDFTVMTEALSRPGVSGGELWECDCGREHAGSVDHCPMCGMENWHRTWENGLTEAEAGVVTYATYCEALDRMATNRPLNEAFFRSRLYDPLNEGVWDAVKDLGGKLVKVFQTCRDEITAIVEQFKIGMADIVKALKHKDAFAFFKAIRFNLGLALKAVTSFTKMVRQGLLSVFEELSKTGVVKKLQAGAMKVDEVLDKYPILKKVGGLVIAGLLIYIWLNMSFIGDAQFDLDLSTIALAFEGSFSIADLFVSPSGLMMLALLGTGFMGIGFGWMGARALNILIALLYTLFKRLRMASPAAALKSGMKLQTVGG